MRFAIAGILAFVLPTVAFAQARGEVESIGFGGIVRPGCWTPMVVRLTPTTGNVFEGRLEVVQEDLDRDNVLFTRQIVLQGNPAAGGETPQIFWMYFIPQPNRGERAVIQSSTTRDELNKIIKVRLTTEGGKELAKIPITQTVTLADELGRSNTHRGQKLVLTVGREHFPRFEEYQQMVGLTEDVQTVTVGDLAKGLPDDVIGYEGVDAVVWSDANPEELNLNPAQLTALQDYVRRGGRLVILQDTQANQQLRNNRVLGALMPVDVTGVVEADRPAALRVLARVDLDPNLPGDPANAVVQSPARDAERDRRTFWDQRGQGLTDNYLRRDTWNALTGPFKKATCTLRPGATVAYYDPSDARPYIVRGPFGTGSVTWVAQDLADKQFHGKLRPTPGWAGVWDRVMDWPNEPAALGQSTPEAIKAQYASNVTVETGRAVLKFMDLPSKSAALIGIAVLFFIVYWVAAGPGSFLLLAKKKKTQLSWFAFAVLAIAGTSLTYLIVKLTLRGGADVAHVTFVRQMPGEPSMVRSEFGLYIPRDGAQKIELTGAADGRSSFVTAFNLHPAFVESDTDFPAKQDYTVPVKAVVEKEKGKENLDPKVIRVPYRSTLKKFQAQWVGDLTKQDENQKGAYAEKSVTLWDKFPRVSGAVRNTTGTTLRRVYFVVHHPGWDKGEGEVMAPADQVLYVSTWKNTESVDLGLAFRRPVDGGAPLLTFFDKDGKDHYPDLNSQSAWQGEILTDRSPLGWNWTEYWYQPLRSTNFTDKELVDDDPLKPQFFPIVSFFDRIPVSRNSRATGAERNRVDLLRRGVRHLDLSAAISAGNLAIIAVSDTRDERLPIPLEVDGDKVSAAAKGVVYHQFVVPVDRSKVANHPPKILPPGGGPATKPAGAGTTTAPAPRAAEK